MRTLFHVCGLLGVIVLCGCNGLSSRDTSSATDTNRQVFEVKGTVKELKPNGKTAAIAHEEIPNYMEAMTMDFDVKNQRELEGLKAGDYIAFRMVVTRDDGWIENVRKLPPPTPTNASQVITINNTNETNAVTFRRSPIVEPLSGPPNANAIVDQKITSFKLVLGTKAFASIGVADPN